MGYQAWAVSHTCFSWLCTRVCFLSAASPTHWLMQERLWGRLQTDMKMPAKLLQQDLQVKWNTTHYMMQSLLEPKRPLSVCAAEHNIPATLTVNQGTLMENTVKVSSLC